MISFDGVLGSVAGDRGSADLGGTKAYRPVGLSVFVLAHLYSVTTDIVMGPIAHPKAIVTSVQAKGHIIQHPGYGLPKTSLPRRWVNRAPIKCPSPYKSGPYG